MNLAERQAEMRERYRVGRVRRRKKRAGKVDVRRDSCPKCGTITLITSQGYIFRHETPGWPRKPCPL